MNFLSDRIYHGDNCLFLVQDTVAKKCLAESRWLISQIKPYFLVTICITYNSKALYVSPTDYWGFSFKELLTHQGYRFKSYLLSVNDIRQIVD